MPNSIAMAKSVLGSSATLDPFIPLCSASFVRRTYIRRTWVGQRSGVRMLNTSAGSAAPDRCLVRPGDLETIWGMVPATSPNASALCRHGCTE
jgi:hypothetical protein